MRVLEPDDHDFSKGSSPATVMSPRHALPVPDESLDFLSCDLAINGT
jgi:hypothetical protein